MAYLKGTKCSKCGGLIRINAYYDEKSNTHYVDGGTCVRCFSETVLPPEPYVEFCRRYGIGSVVSYLDV